MPTQSPVIRSVHLSAPSVPRFAMLELRVDLEAPADNPFDPAQIDLSAEFTGPGGRTVRVNGFLDRPWSRRLEGDREVLVPAGPTQWKVRFAPDRTGRWTARVRLRAPAGTAEHSPLAFTVTPSVSRGFIRRSRRNPAVFAYADETPFILVGENMCWGGWNGRRGTFDYDAWLDALARHGGNWIRIWMSSWNCALEWSPDKEAGYGEFRGVGRFNLAHAWKLDRILDEAERRGIAVMLCLGTYGEFTEGGFFGEGQWKANPYNQANGGPCARPADFWTNPRARELYRRRLRYLAARYAHRTCLHSWEFWNEALAPPEWVREMAQCLKGTGPFAGDPLDPYGHLVSTSYGNDAVWRIPEIDFTQTHHYGKGDIPDSAPVIREDALAHARHGKPHLMAEFGIDWRKGDENYDPDGRGVNLHNGLWSSLLSGNAGGGMIWWWDGYVHPKNLYSRFASLRRFADQVDWTAGPWQQLQASPPELEGPGGKPGDLRLPATAGWGRAAEEPWTITPLGPDGSRPLPSFLYAPAKPDLRTTPRLRVDFAQPGRFSIRVSRVSVAARLRILLDGQPAADVRLSAAPPARPGATPEYKSTALNKEHNVWQAEFDREIAIAVPAGPHEITLENMEGDWAEVSEYVLAPYRSARAANLNLYGLAHGRTAVLWAQNRDHCWKNVFEKRPIPPVAGARTTIRGLPPGRCVVEWWDTWKGEPVRREEAVVGPSGLVLRLPVIERDVAARVLPAPPARSPRDR